MDTAKWAENNTSVDYNLDKKSDSGAIKMKI